MSTTTVVVLVVASVLVIVIALMVGLRRRAKDRPVARSAAERYRDDYGPVAAPEVSLADNYRGTSVFDDDPDVEEGLPRREPGKVWDDPEPFESEWPRRDRDVERRHRRAPMIRRDSGVGLDPELPEDDWAWPRASGGADVAQLDPSPTRDDPFVEPARCEPIAHPGPGTYPAQEVSSPAASDSSRDDSGSSTSSGWSNSGGSDSGSSGSSGDSGSGSSGGCD